MHILDTLKERGFIAQTTFEGTYTSSLKGIHHLYVGFDHRRQPTLWSFYTYTAMAHMQRAGIGQ